MSTVKINVSFIFSDKYLNMCSLCFHMGRGFLKKNFQSSEQEEMFAVLYAGQQVLADECRVLCAKHLVKLQTMKGLWILFIQQQLR